MSKKKILEENQYIAGIFSRHEKGFGFVKVEGQEEEIYIPANQTKNALHGDKVLIEIAKTNAYGGRKPVQFDDDSRTEGTIIRVLKHAKDTLVGTFKNNKKYGFVIPDDKKFGTDIYIQKKYFNTAKDNSKVVVKITRYPEKDKSAEGEIIEILGNINEAGVDMLSLIREYDLPYEFPKKVMDEVSRNKRRNF